MLRSLVEGQLAGFAFNDLKRRDAAKADVLRRLIAAGFGAPLARELVAELPDGLDAARGLRLIKSTLQRRLPLAAGAETLVEQGGMFALVGPTGVGKTTTVAKLAAECALKRGAGSLALVTTDTYRIGAVDQLRIYGKILGVPVFAIRDEADLRATLAELRMRHLVLIDTVGMSQRDRRLADQVALLAGGGSRVRRILLLSAVSQASVLEDVARAYRGAELAGCILTKVDEALMLGGALDVLIRHRLTLHYVTNGQRVPEDLHRPNPLYLVERAFRAAAERCRGRRGRASAHACGGCAALTIALEHAADQAAGLRRLLRPAAPRMIAFCSAARCGPQRAVRELRRGARARRSARAGAGLRGRGRRLRCWGPGPAGPAGRCARRPRSPRVRCAGAARALAVVRAGRAFRGLAQVSVRDRERLVASARG